MNLNVITRGDALRTLSSVKVDPAAPGDIADEQKQTESGKVPQVTADDLYSRLLKYIPGPLDGMGEALLRHLRGAIGDERVRHA